MRTFVTGTCVVLTLGACGLVVSQALSLERWVAFARLAAPPALGQKTRLPAKPVLRSRFAWPVPAGWSAPRLVEEPARPDQALLTRLGLPSAQAADVALPPVAGLSLVEAPSVGPWPRHIPVAASVMHYRPALGRAVAPEDCTSAIPLPDAKPVQRILASMPDKCDDKLWGKWVCRPEGRTSSGSWKYKATEYTFSRTIGEGGYEHVRLDQQNQGYRGVVTQNWKVDRKWHPAPRGWIPLPAGRLASATCNGRSKQGYRTLNVYEKNPDGSARTLVSFYVDSEGVGWEVRYQVWWKGDKMYVKKRDHVRCDRET